MEEKKATQVRAATNEKSNNILASLYRKRKNRLENKAMGW